MKGGFGYQHTLTTWTRGIPVVMSISSGAYRRSFRDSRPSWHVRVLRRQQPWTLRESRREHPLALSAGSVAGSETALL